MIEKVVPTSIGIMVGLFLTIITVRITVIILEFIIIILIFRTKFFKMP